VVIGWDGSSGADAALAAASRLLPHRHLVAVSVDDDSDAPAPESIGDARLTRVSVDLGRGRHTHAVAQALIGAADEHGAALVVVGSRGRSVAREIILGSVAMGTLHDCHRPVMVVPG
jgi:nucleotide-binding universal stress UspA family protein